MLGGGRHFKSWGFIANMLDTKQKTCFAFVLVFVIFAGLFRFWLAPFFLKLPANFTYEGQLTSVDNFYDESLQKFAGEQYSKSNFSYRVTDSVSGIYSVENTFSVSTLDDQPIFSTVRNYGIDSITWAQVPGFGDHDREGYLFAPSGLDPNESFTYWHVNYDAPAKMTFLESTTLFGLPVNHYESYYEDIWVDQTDSLDGLPGVPEERGIVVEPHLELWIEPASGYLVKYHDDTYAYYYDINTQEKLDPWNHFSNTFSDDSVQQHVKEAEVWRMKHYFYYYVLPLCLLGLALVSLLISFHHKKNLKKGGTGLSWIIMGTFVVLPVSTYLVSTFLLRNVLYSEVNRSFDDRVQLLEDSILKRTEIYSNTLTGAAGLFTSSEEVTREEWKAYADRIDLQGNYPGVLGLGYVLLVNPEEKAAHVQKIREEGFPNYTIFPEGDRAVYSTVLYLEPFVGGNVLVMGYDMLSEPIRQLAMDQARDNGVVSISGLVHLIQDLGDPDKRGFLMYVPIYAKGLPLETVDERRVALTGYAYSPFRAEDFINGLFSSSDLGVNFALYDGVSPDSSNLIFERLEDDIPYGELSYNKITTFYLLGRPWTLKVGGLSEFKLSSEQSYLLYSEVIFGSLVTLFFIFLFFALYLSRQNMIDFIARKKGFGS